MATSNLSLIPSSATEVKDLLIYSSLGILLGIGTTKLISHFKSSDTKIKHVLIPNAFESKLVVPLGSKF